MILHPCAHPGCGKDIPIDQRFCEKHKNDPLEWQRIKRRDRDRKKKPRICDTGRPRVYNTRGWKKLRAAHLRRHPLCEECLKRGIVTIATDVDHIVPHRGDPSLMWNPENLQSLCHSCHSRKTAREDGGFGNVKREPGRRVEK